MTTAEQIKMVQENLKLIAILAMERVFGPNKLSWSYFANYNLTLNQEEAEQYLKGKIIDPKRQALYGILFEEHPELKNPIYKEHGFEPCEFEPDKCERCGKIKPLYFGDRDYWDNREGAYVCSECVDKRIMENGQHDGY